MNRSAIRLLGALATVVLSTPAAPGQALPPCALPKADAPTIPRTSQGPGYTVDACGRIVNDAGILLPFVPRKGSGRDSVGALTAAPQVTIAQMATYSSRSHAADGALTIVGPGQHYFLSDGSDWYGGSGFDVAYQVRLDHVEVSGTTLRYFLLPPISTRIFQGSDFDSGLHSAQGILGAVGPLVLEATDGGTTGVLHGQARIISNDATSYGEPRFNYYTAPVGSVVPFDTTITLPETTFTADLFTRFFYYDVAAIVDFASPVSVPHAIALTVSGPSRVAGGLSFRYRANVLYEGGSIRDLSTTSTWGIDPSDSASVANGVLTTGTLAVSEEQLTLQASFTNGVDAVSGQKQVRFLAQDPAETPGSWPMFQANARHTGFSASNLDPAGLALRWQKTVSDGSALNPVAAGEGKVFASFSSPSNDVQSLFALDAATGTTLWSRGFGPVFAVNAPSFAYGSVYLQSGQGSSLPALWSLDGDTGAVNFQTVFESQWAQFLAPTVFDRKIYGNGGSSGGIYAFDGDSASPLWFASTPQYNGLTPAVDADRVWAYGGAYPSGLYGELRSTGGIDLYVPDPGDQSGSGIAGPTPVLGTHDDLIAVQGGRLISFDLVLGTIRWQLPSNFSGQPSLAGDKVFAVDDGSLRVVDELTHASLWSWTSGDGPIAAPMIVTPGYVFASTASSVHAISLATHAEVWSYPVSGQLAIADDTLYVASSSGVLTAFKVPLIPPGPPPLDFYTVTPCRVFDSRNASGPAAGAPSLEGAESRLVTFTGRCGLPPGAKAVSVNVTAILPGAGGRLNLGLSGLPSLQVVSYSAGQVRANNAFVSLSANGDLFLTADQPPLTFVDVAIDVNGYFQ